jgi:hypothetical protein
MCCLYENVWDAIHSNGQLALYVCICLKTGSFIKTIYCKFFVKPLLSSAHGIITHRDLMVIPILVRKRYHLISSKDFLVGGGELKGQ